LRFAGFAAGNVAPANLPIRAGMSEVTPDIGLVLLRNGG
jgi:hypothetical protein